MASSLDDMEAYELLQIELDRSLHVFINNLSQTNKDKAEVLHFFNHWIEYICFVRHLSVWEEITTTATEDAFKKWYEELAGTINQQQTNSLHAFQTFFEK